MSRRSGCWQNSVLSLNEKHLSNELLTGLSHAVTLPEGSGSQFEGARIPYLPLSIWGLFVIFLSLSLLAN